MESNTSNPWTKTPLGEVTEEIRDRVSSPDGDCMSVYGVERQDDFMITAKYSATDLSRYKKIKPGDFAYNPMRLNIGSIGMCGFHQAPGLISPDYIGFRCIDNKLYPAFLRHVIKGHEWINGTESAGVGSVRQRIYYKEIANLALTMPPFEEQKAIAKALDSIDVLIDLNTRTNATLEEMSRTLFRSWFVDFEPVHANAEGRQPEGMDAETAALFPSEFVESELGMIPKGWEVKPIGECVQAVGGGTPKTAESEYWEGGTIHWATPKDLSNLSSPVLLGTERQITELGLKQISSGLLPVGTVLLSSRAPIGYLVISEVPVAVNQGFIAMVCNGPLPNHYVLHWAKANMETIEGRANGSTFMEISKSAFRPIPAIVPSSKVLTAFVEQVGPLYRQVVRNLQETQTLIEARASLLLKLISGEVRLPEDMVAEFEVNA
jgi:type I restriction enzyme S subunit